MKKIALIIALSFAFLGFSQEVKLKKGSVLIDGNPWLKYQDCGGFDSTCSLLNTTGDEIIFFKWVKVPGAEPRTSSNPEGNLTYVEISFLGLNKKFEIQKTQKNIIEMIYLGKIVNEDGTLNEEKVNRMVEKYGTPFSDRLNAGTKNTIIIRDEPSRGSGVNINIGR
jgi:hypothetical protein